MIGVKLSKKFFLWNKTGHKMDSFVQNQEIQTIQFCLSQHLVFLRFTTGYFKFKLIILLFQPDGGDGVETLVSAEPND